MQASELSAVTGEFLVLPEAWGDMTRWHQRMGEVRRAAGGRAHDQALGHGGDDGVEGGGHWSDSCQVRPSRSRSVAAAVGPLVPAG